MLGFDFRYKNIARTFFAGLLLLLLVGSFYYAVKSHDGMRMAGCPFEPGNSAICNDTPLEHIQEWQSLFTVLPNTETSLFALIILFVFLALRSKRTDLYRSSRKLFFTPIPRYLELPIFDPLKEAFSSGILNPKIYHLA